MTSYPSSNGVDSDPQDIAAGSDGALWFTGLAADSIRRITTSGTLTNYRDLRGRYLDGFVRRKYLPYDAGRFRTVRCHP